MKHHVVVGVGVAAVLFGALGAREARAEDESGVLGVPQARGMSRQNFAMEIRGAAYSPRVDSDPSLNAQNPYQRVFGTDPRLEIALELDWEALHIPHVGSIGPGVSIGYTTASGIAPRVDGLLPASAETTSLSIYPFYGVGVFRLDALADIGIPLVPFVKGGIGYALWTASNSGGTSQSPDKSTSGKGHTWGTHVALGLALRLDAFDHHAQQQLDQSTGINHTYLFAEYMMSDLTGLGQTQALYVGTHSLAGGLAFEF